MFTGIVEEMGTVEGLQKAKNLCVLKLKVRKVLKWIKSGDSVAVDGVCLTVTKKQNSHLTFDIMQETILCTSLRNLKVKGKVNLERALQVTDRLSGHFVTGHIDCVSTVLKRIEKPNYVELQIAKPRAIAKYLVKKGSIGIDGVGLTVGNVTDKYFSVYLIPFTLRETTLGVKKAKDQVNIETDILAKYILESR